MDIIKFNTTLKASGKDYFKIVFWNRLIRNPIELILSWLPAVISLVTADFRFHFRRNAADFDFQKLLMLC